MPYAPGVTDISGQLQAQGILGAMQNFSKGLEAYKQKQEENKALESENKALELIAKSTAGKVGLPPEMIDQALLSSPDESPRAKNARLKTMTHGILTQAKLDDEQAQRALIIAQTGQIGASQARDQRNQTAARTAVSPIVEAADPRPRTAEEGLYVMQDPNITPPPTSRDPTADEAMRRYLAAGGNDRTQADMIIAAAKPQKTERKLETITLKDEQGNPVSFAWDGASAPQRISAKPAAPEKPMSSAGKLLSDAKTLETAGDTENAKLLRTIAAKQGEDKPMDITAFLISGGEASKYRDYVDQFRADRAKSVTPGKEPDTAKDAEPPTVSPEQARQLPKGTKFKTTDGRILIKQ